MKKIFSIILMIISLNSAFGQWNTDRIIRIGERALYNNEYMLAIQYFNQIIKIKPYLAEPYIYRGIAKISLEDYAGAEQDCNLAIEKNPFVPKAYYARGFVRKKLNKLYEAEQDFSKAIEFSPDNYIYLLNRAEVKEIQDRYKDAEKDLLVVKRVKPKENSVNYQLAILKLKEKDTVSAFKYIDEFIDNDSYSPIGYSARALINMQQKNMDEAYHDYSTAIKHNSQNVGDYINRGILNVDKNRFAQALSDYSKAIQIDPTNVLTYYNRGVLRAKLGDKNNAIGDFNKVVQKDSSNYEAIYQKAILEVEVGDLSNAENDYNKILKKYPYFVPAYYGIAQAREKSGDIKGSLKYSRMGSEIYNNKEYYQKKMVLDAKNRADNSICMAENSTQKSVLNSIINETKDSENEKNSSIINDNSDIANLELEPNFALNYYSPSINPTRTNIYHPIIANLDAKLTKNAPKIRIMNRFLNSNADIVNSHFEIIQELTAQIAKRPLNGYLYFERSISFNVVGDFYSALDDLNRTIELIPNLSIAYFERANIFSILDKTNSDKAASISTISISKSYYHSAIDDYKRVIELQPDFSFAYFNLANILSLHNDTQNAIKFYFKVLSYDSDFAESYYNIALTYLKQNKILMAEKNFSKAGELGIKKAYSLIREINRATER